MVALLGVEPAGVGVGEEDLADGVYPAALFVSVEESAAGEDRLPDEDGGEQLPLLLGVEVAMHVGHPPGPDLEAVVRRQRAGRRDGGAEGVFAGGIPGVVVVGSMDVVRHARLSEGDEAGAQEVAHLGGQALVLRRVAARLQVRATRPTCARIV